MLSSKQCTNCAHVLRTLRTLRTRAQLQFSHVRKMWYFAKCKHFAKSHFAEMLSKSVRYAVPHPIVARLRPLVVRCKTCKEIRLLHVFVHATHVRLAHIRNMLKNCRELSNSQRSLFFLILFNTIETTQKNCVSGYVSKKNFLLFGIKSVIIKYMQRRFFCGYSAELYYVEL